MTILPNKYDPSSDKPNGEYLCDDSLYQAEFPAIYEYLARVAVEGHSRLPSRLVAYYEDGQAVLLLTDPHSAKILFHAAETFSDALEGLNSRLANPPVKGWKKDKRARLR